MYSCTKLTRYINNPKQIQRYSQRFYEFNDMTTSKAPVPVKFKRPATMLPDGVLRSSKSPCNVASERKEAVVSYDALRSGEGLVEIPDRLNGL